MEKKVRNKKEMGITLIALVITIIVLLILAGISILTLTGEHGILNKANQATKETTKETAKEKVQLAVMGSYGTDGKLNYEELKNNLDKVEGIVKVPSKIEKLPIEVYVDGYKVTIEGNGNVIIDDKKTEDIPQIPSTIEGAKEQGTVLDENNPVTIKDKYDNNIVVPEGFKIAEDSAEDVTGGIVIEDGSNPKTNGSQFVWIPVGEIKGENGVTQTIELNRYSFAQDGTPTAQGDKPQIVGSGSYEELVTSDKGNTTARDLEGFKTSVATNEGFYIGRYEARKQTDKNGLEQVTLKGDDLIYNTITEPQAATLSREMYAESKKFTSDLMNSYAWETAILFVQKFDDRQTKSKPYSMQTTLNESLAQTGTNLLEDKTRQDKICNIWDMASNALEWTTETCSFSSYNCAYRGGSSKQPEYCTNSRGGYPTTYATDEFTFRPILYIK